MSKDTATSRWVKWRCVQTLVVGLLAIFFHPTRVYAQPDSKKNADKDPSIAIPATMVHDVESLAALLRPRMPKGWSMTVKGERVMFERPEPVELYNGLGLPLFKSEAKRHAYLKQQAWRDKLTISLWIGEYMDSEDIKQAVRKNWEAIDQARKDHSDGKFMPGTKFWNEHAEYGYREIPILDTGSQSIYMESYPEGVILSPTNEPRSSRSGRVIGFYDKNVEKECQGFIDDLRAIYRAY